MSQPGEFRMKHARRVILANGVEPGVGFNSAHFDSRVRKWLTVGMGLAVTLVAASWAFTPSAAQQTQGILPGSWALDLLNDAQSDLQYVFGPQQGHGTGDCPPPNPAPPPNPDSPGGCVVRFVIRPSAIEVDLKVFNLPAVGSVSALACRDSTHCPAAATATKVSSPTPPEPVLYSARLTLTSSNVDGIIRICGLAVVFVPTPLKSYPLACLNL